MLTEEKEGLLGCSQSDETRTKWMVQEQEWMKTGDEQCGCCPRSCCCRGMNGLQCLWLRIKISMVLGLLFTMISGVWDVLKISEKQEAFVVPGALFVVFRVLLSLYGMFCACKEKRQLLPQFMLATLMVLIFNLTLQVVNFSSTSSDCKLPQSAFKGCSPAPIHPTNLTDCLVMDSCSHEQLDGSGCQAVAFEECADAVNSSNLTLQMVNSCLSILGELTPLSAILLVSFLPSTQVSVPRLL